MSADLNAPQHINSSTGDQKNYSQSGGSSHTQYNAQTLNITHASPPDQARDHCKECRDALFLTFPEGDRANLISAKGKRVDGTCEWIKEDDAYNSWLRGDTQLLWVYGGPGKGKTMMSIFLTQELEEEKQLIYYFCTAEDEKRNNAVSILRGLLWQLTRKQPELTEHLVQYFDTPEKTQAMLSSREMLWIMFIKLMQDPRLNTIYCLLDGLDECDDDSTQWLAVRFAEFHLERGNSRLQLIIVSRDIPKLRTSMQVKLDPDNDEKVSTDIKAFVTIKVLELLQQLRFSEESQKQLFQKHVEDALLKRAEGTFLWVGFVMAELSKKNTPTEVEATLDSLPNGLFPLYRRMLQQIGANHRETSARLLRWVAMSVRPLSLAELGAAIGCRSLGRVSKDQAIRDQVTICEPFIRVMEQGFVGLVHESAREFLLREETDGAAALGDFRIKSAEVHLEIARTCLDCIGQSELQDSADLWDPFDTRNSPSQQDPLLEYAVLYWPEHVTQSLTFAKQLIESLTFFSSEESTARDNWWRMYCNRNGKSFLEDLPLLHVACYLGIVPWIQMILSRERSFTFWRRSNKDDSEIHMSLWFAAYGRHEEVTRLLIHHGADVKSEEGSEALIEAVDIGHEAVVRLLLDCGADSNARARPGGCTALIRAAERGHKTVVHLLLDHGADINGKDVFRTHTALIGATIEGHETMVRLLLDRGADINTKNQNESIELAAAAYRGNETIVRLFLDRGVDVNAKGPDGNTALAWAARGGHEAVVRLLLNRGADIHTDEVLWGHTALSLAAREGHEAEVRLLLDRGADTNVTDIFGGSGVALATRKWHNAVVRLMVDRQKPLDRVSKLTKYYQILTS